MARSVVQAPENFVGRGRQLWRALVLLVVGGFLLLAYLVWSAYLDTAAEAELTAKNYAELVDARFEASLRRVDSDLTQFAERIPGELLGQAVSGGALQALERDLQRYRLGFPEAGDFLVVDAQGNLLNLTNSSFNIGDRAYFLWLREHPEAGTVFSEVLVSRLDGKQTIVAARAIRDPADHFLGVVMVQLHLDYFAHLFDPMRMGASGALEIRRADDHKLVMHVPTINDAVNQLPGEGYPLYEILASGSTHGMPDFE
jgi:hypothetical protein